MSDINEILNQLFTEKEIALSRVRLLDEVISTIQSDGLSGDNIQHLESFLEASKIGQKKSIITVASKMNDHADLLNEYPGYSDTKNVKEKIVIILEAVKRFTPIKEIADILRKLDFDNSKRIEDYVKNISPVLSIMAKNGDRICKITEDGNKKSTIWGLQIWMENGYPKNDYLI